jgi:hypothetical protein
MDEEKNDFAYQIWELENKVKAGELHLKEFREANKYFKNSNKRVKGTDTLFYEQNLPEWKRRFETSTKQFKQDHGEEYDRKEVKFSWDKEV